MIPTRQYSIGGLLAFIAAVPISACVAISLYLAAPWILDYILGRGWAIRTVTAFSDVIPSSLRMECVASVASAPTIVSISILACLLGATRSRFGWSVGVLVPIAAFFCAMYYMAPLGWAAYLPFLIGLIPSWIGLSIGAMASRQYCTDRRRAGFQLFRVAIWFCVGGLVATSYYWHRVFVASLYQ